MGVIHDPRFCILNLPGEDLEAVGVVEKIWEGNDQMRMGFPQFRPDIGK